MKGTLCPYTRTTKGKRMERRRSTEFSKGDSDVKNRYVYYEIVVHGFISSLFTRNLNIGVSPSRNHHLKLGRLLEKLRSNKYWIRG